MINRLRLVLLLRVMFYACLLWLALLVLVLFIVAITAGNPAAGAFSRQYIETPATVLALSFALLRIIGSYFLGAKANDGEQ